MTDEECEILRRLVRDTKSGRVYMDQNGLQRLERIHAAASTAAGPIQRDINWMMWFARNRSPYYRTERPGGLLSRKRRQVLKTDIDPMRGKG